MSEKEEYYPWYLNSFLLTSKNSISDARPNMNQTIETPQNKTNQTNKKRKLNILNK